MNVGMLTLLGSLTAAAGPVAPVAPTGVPAGVAGVGSPGAMPMPAMTMPFPQPGLGAPAPVLAARVLAPQGVRVTAYPGTPGARMFDAPSVFGLRPGYRYRLELSNLPYHPGRVLYPEVEVRGTIVPRPGMKYMDYPVPLLFTASDIERALAGVVVTKVIYLENPEKALPVEVRPDFPVEFPADTEQEAIDGAIANGRLVAIVRLGDRRPTAEWLRMTAIDGTILLPGERYLKAPAVPPTLPFFACPLFDPILGPKPPNEECFVDGDDKKEPLGIGPDGKLGGLNPTDVGVEYTINGRRKVTTSCQVCICSPRFMIRKVELAPGGYNVAVPITGNTGLVALAGAKERYAPMVDIGREKPSEFDARIRPLAYIGKVGTAFYVGTSKPSVVGQIQGLAVTGALVEPELLTNTACPLSVSKTVEPPGPKQPGDIVTFTITFKNTGSQPISDLVVSDSLSGRLEYVQGTAVTDRPANFTASANEVGSVIMRWDLPGTLYPGQAGTVKFKAKVR